MRQNGLDKNHKYNVAEISRKITNQLGQHTEDRLMQEYSFKDISILKKAIQYNNDKAGGQIESLCYQINKGQL